MVAKRAGEKFKRIKCSTLAKLLNGLNFHESVYNWQGGDDNEESKEDIRKIPLSNNQYETESIYSMRTDNTQASAVTVATDQLGITVMNKLLLDSMIFIV